MVKDALIIGGYKHIGQSLAFFSLFIYPLYHAFAANINKRLYPESG
jgi:hypothetical protein